jgi:putative peptidoglycan lipid II flippase
MVKKFLVRANQKASFGFAATLLAGSSLIGSVLGLLRDRFLYGGFGLESSQVAAFKAAFTVPDFMFFILISGALSVTFIPIFNERYVKGNKKSAWELSSSLLNMFAVLTFFTSIAILIFAEPLVKYVVAPGLDEHTTFLAVSMMRILAVNPLLFSISSVFVAMQQAVGRFFFISLAPSIYNLSVIFGVVFLSQRFGIMGVAFGVVIGSILQLLVSVLGLAGLNFEYSPKIFWKNLGFRKLLKVLPARSADQGMDYFNNIVEVNLASRLGTGAIGSFSAAYTLHNVPVTLIGVALSTAAFPKMTERIAQGRPDLFKKELAGLLRLVIWFSLPAVTITFLMRGYLIRISAGDGYATAAAILGIFAWAVMFRALYHVLSRSFYAQQDTKTPLYVSIFAISLNIVLAITLARQSVYGIIGLPLAQVIVAAAEVGILAVILSKRFPGTLNRVFFGALWRMLSAFGITFWVTWLLRRQLFELGASDRGFLTIVPKLGLLCTIVLLLYVIISWLFKLEEVEPIIAKLRTILFKPVRLQ